MFREDIYNAMSSAKRMDLTSWLLTFSIGMSDIYKLYKIGPRTEPCGTPSMTLNELDSLLSILTLNDRLVNMSVVSLSSGWRIECCLRKPNWLAGIMLLESVMLTILLSNNLS